MEVNDSSSAVISFDAFDENRLGYRLDRINNRGSSQNVSHYNDSSYQYDSDDSG